MPSLRELMELVSMRAAESGHPLPSRLVAKIESDIRSTWPAQRVYISPADSRRDPARAEVIKQAAKRLPARVVAERHGVSPQWVYRLLKK